MPISRTLTAGGSDFGASQLPVADFAKGQQQVGQARRDGGLGEEESAAGEFRCGGVQGHGGVGHQAELHARPGTDGFAVARHPLTNGTVDPAQLLTRHEPMTDVLQAYRQFQDRDPGWLKVALTT
ncbi:hypothetical protein [Micromonospora sp. NPDC085948]|uniref:hypothetical protein n=1 Tax=Micromonospora sp. NPDC085948 TaxID=3155293 RepID=UPI00342C6B47